MLSQVYHICNDGATRSACVSGLQMQLQGLLGDELLIALFSASSVLLELAEPELDECFAAS